MAYRLVVVRPSWVFPRACLPQGPRPRPRLLAPRGSRTHSIDVEERGGSHALKNLLVSIEYNNFAFGLMVIGFVHVFLHNFLK